MDELLCCPIPLSLPAALARQSCSEDAGPMTDVLGVLTLGLSSDTATNTRCNQTRHSTCLWLRLAQRANMLEVILACIIPTDINIPLATTG